MNIDTLPSAPGIYKLECLEDGKIYIGQSVNIRERAHEHRRALEKNCHNNTKMQHYYNKYGKESFVFTVVEIVKNKEYLYKREEFWAKYYNSFDRKKGFNICPIVKNEFDKQEFANKVKGTKNGRAKLTEEDVVKICKLLNNRNLTYTEIGHLFGVSYTAIRNIKVGRNWQDISSKYLDDDIKKHKNKEFVV